MIETIPWLFLLCLFIISILYASVGHGGASGYLALMALFSISPASMKSSALILNVFVSLVAFYEYYKAGYFKWNLFIPFALTSVPASFIGATITIDPVVYKRILGIILIFPILRLLGVFGSKTQPTQPVNRNWALVIGAVIGFLSGIIGIGGGIILSPVIILMNWGEMKETAAVSSLFILVNSIAGIIGLVSKGIVIDNAVYVWLIVTLIGGFMGAYAGSKKFTNPVLNKILALVLLIASIKLFKV